MTQFNFMPHATLHCFCDGSGVAIYSAYTGDTVVLRSELRDAMILQSFSALTYFNPIDIQKSFGLRTDEAGRVLQYLIDKHLVTKSAGC